MTGDIYLMVFPGFGHYLSFVSGTLKMPLPTDHRKQSEDPTPSFPRDGVGDLWLFGGSWMFVII